MYSFKWGLFDNNFQNQIPEHFSGLWGINFGPNVVEGFGWTSDRLRSGKDKLDWLTTSEKATKALAGGAKKLLIATQFHHHLAHLAATGMNFRMLSIRIVGPMGAALYLLNFSDVEILDSSLTANYQAVLLKVHDSTVDVFRGVESSGPLDHSKQKRKEAETLRMMELLDKLNNKLNK